ncbi:MAG: APC family permease [Mycoplasmoidaceae bacterium]
MIFSKREKKERKTFRPLDIILFTFSAVFVLDSLGLSLTMGWSSIIWWIFLGIAFFLPYGLITAELTTTYPNGGIYNWVVKGLGIKNGARSNFYYWINVAFWMPSVYLVLGSTFFYSIDPSLVEEQWFIWINVAIAIAATWLTWAINKIDLEKAKWLPNLGSIIKLFLVLMMLVSMIVFLVQNNGVISTLIDGQGGIAPDFAAPFGVVGIIVYNMCGFELSTNLGSDVQEVKKTIPKSLLIGGLTIIFAYIIASIPAFIVLDTQDPAYQDGGYINSIVAVFSGALPQWLVIILSIMLALTLITNMLSWTLGSNRAIAEAAENGEMPKSFAKLNKYQCPTFASTALSIISTISILIGGLMEFLGAGSAYFILFSFSLIIFFFPYIQIFRSYIKLRSTDKNVIRPFAIRNLFLAKTLGTIALMIVIIACITQVLDITSTDGGISILPVPDFGTGGLAWGSLAVTVVGIIICIIVGDVMIYWARRKPTNKSGSNQSLLIKDEDDQKLVLEKVKTKIKKEKDNFHYFKNEIKGVLCQYY